MNWIFEFGRRPFQLFRRRRFDSDLAEEMRLHRDLCEQEHMERGLSPKEAHYTAQKRFGNDLVLREESRDMWGWNWLEDLLQDIRYGVRMLVKNPGFMVVAVLTLALGIGANTAIFSVVNTVLLQPLPYGDADRLVMVWGYDRPHRYNTDQVSPPDFRDWQSQNHVFEAMAGSTDVMYTLTGTGEPAPITGYEFSAEYFRVLGVAPLIGRTF